MYKILIAAGGSGGHLFPAQQLIEKIQEKAGSKVEVLFAGAGLAENPFFKKEAYPFREIVSVAPKRKNLWRFCVGSLKGFFQAICLLRSFRPDVVVGFGSYHTFTTLLASVVLRKKLVLFEANCVLGKVNRLFAPFASKLALQFPLYQKTNLSEHVLLREEKKNQVFVHPFPWRKTEKQTFSKEEARIFYGLDPHRPTILVFGGSQGAAFLNAVMPKVLNTMRSLQVIHLTGKGSAQYDHPFCLIKPFESEMHIAYAAADIVVSRSGAATIGELMIYRKKALLIPFPQAADQHQWVNAHFLMQKQSGVHVVVEKDATPERIAKEITCLLQEEVSLVLQESASSLVGLEEIVL